LREWYQLGLVTTEETYGSYTSNLFTEVDPTKLNSYMTIGSSAGASYQCPKLVTNENNEAVYPFEVGVALPPQLNANSPKVISQGPNLCMFKKANKQEMAATWLLMKFLTTNMGLQADFSSTSGYAPVISKLDTKFDAYKTFIESADGNQFLQASCVKQCLSQEGAMFVSPAFVGSSGARDEVGILLQNCFVGQLASGQTAADLVKTEFETIVAKLRYDYGA
jgi:ABC-type glycerol-3-phosphate transport system substrate-binding protein